MKSWHLLAVAISIGGLGMLWLSFTGNETATAPVTVEHVQAPAANSETEAPMMHNQQLALANKLEAEDSAASLHSESVSPSEIVKTEPESDQPIQQANALLQQASQELQLEAGLSAFNLMLLKDLATRLNELPSADQALLQNNTAEWPAALRDTLYRLSSALQAETELRKSWQESASQNPEGFREAWLTQQNQILGPELYGKLYAEDEMLVDDAGLNAHYSSETDAPLLESKVHQEKRKLLAQWRQEKLSEAELTEALADSLSAEEINQLIDTGLHEVAWLDQLDTFLDEYHYIEQSGIIGEDELLMRKELIEKHFPPENRAIVNQFLFGTQEKP